MKRAEMILAVTVGLLAVASAVWAAYTTNIIFGLGDGIVTCTTCCYRPTCMTNCF